MNYTKLVKQISTLFEDDDLIIVNKPSGLLTIADRYDTTIPNLKSILLKSHDEIYTVHRLDRDTSGVICFAKKQETHKYLNTLFAQRVVRKKYWAFVEGNPSLESGCVDMPILNDMSNSGRMLIHKSGKEAQTDFELKENFGNISLIEFEPITGRTHQIRVHSQFLGCPLLVDPLYNKKAFFLSTIKRKYNKGTFENERPLVSRLTLHAKAILFNKEDGTRVEAHADLPKELKALHKQLQKNS